MTLWQRLHFKFGIPEPLIEPLAVERLYLNNYFSIAKAKRDLVVDKLGLRTVGDAVAYIQKLEAENSDAADAIRAKIEADKTTGE